MHQQSATAGGDARLGPVVSLILFFCLFVFHHGVSATLCILISGVYSDTAKQKINEIQRNEHVVPLGKSIWNYRWPEEPGLAAAPVCPRSAAEEKAELFCQVRFGREKVHLQILGMPSKKQNGK